jgi:Na+/proline symporter
MPNLGMPVAEWISFIFFLLLSTLLGFWMVRRIHGLGDYVLPRWFGKTMMVLHGFSTGTHSDQAVVVASKTYTNGVSGIWYQWLYIFITPFYWVVSLVLRRSRAMTTSDIFEARYDRSVAVLFALVCMGNQALSMGTMLRSAGSIIEGSTGGQLSDDLVILLMTVCFVLYGTAGGLAAAVVNDFVQGILTVVFSFILLPFMLDAVGGITGIHRALIDDPHKLMLFEPKEINLFLVVVLSINSLVSIVAVPVSLGCSSAGRTEMDNQIGFTYGNFLKRICTIPWCLTGLAAIVYFGKRGVNIKPNDIYGLSAAEFLPKAMPGLLGMFLASLLATIMSSCSAMMVAISGLFTNNVYKYAKPGQSEKHYLTVARISSAAMVAGGLGFAYLYNDVVKMLLDQWKVLSLMGIAFWLGLIWRRANVAGAWAATLAATAIFFLFKYKMLTGIIAALPFASSLGMVIEKSPGDIFIPEEWQIIFQLGGGFAAGILVSFLTLPVSKEKLDRFYALIRTPTQPDEKIAAPCTLPEGTVVPPKRLLFPFGGLEILVPSRRTVIGVLVCAALVGVLVGYVAIFIAK